MIAALGIRGFFTSSSPGVGAFATTLRPKDGRENWRWSTWYGRATGLSRVHLGANYSRGEFAAGPFLRCAPLVMLLSWTGKFIRLCRILRGAINQCPLAQRFLFFRWPCSAFHIWKNTNPASGVCFMNGLKTPCNLIVVIHNMTILKYTKSQLDIMTGTHAHTSEGHHLLHSLWAILSRPLYSVPRDHMGSEVVL